MTVGEEEGGDTTYERIADSENEVGLSCRYVFIGDSWPISQVVQER